MSSNERPVFGSCCRQKIEAKYLLCAGNGINNLFLFHDRYIDVCFCPAASIAAYFSQDVIAIYNDAALNSKFNAFANVIGLGVSLLLRLVVVHANLDIKFLAIPIITVAIIPYYIRVFF